MNGKAITLLVELRCKRDNQLVRLKASTHAEDHESDKQLIDRLMRDEQLDFKNYELVDYQVDQAQIELF